MRCANRTASGLVQCTLEAQHEGDHENHNHPCATDVIRWPRLHMLGVGPILWRQVVNRHYPGRNLGDSPPFTRAHLETIEAHRCPASREYYAWIDNI